MGSGEGWAIAVLKRDSSRAGLVPLSHLRYQVRDEVRIMVRVRVRVGV